MSEPTEGATPTEPTAPAAPEPTAPQVPDQEPGKAPEGYVAREVVDRYAKKAERAEAQLKKFKEEQEAAAKEAERAKMDEVERLKLEKQEIAQKLEQEAQERRRFMVDSEIKVAGLREGVLDPNDLLAIVSREGIKVDENGQLVGVAEAVAKMKEAKPYLFGSGKSPVGGTTPTTMSPRDSGQQRDADQMTAAEDRAALSRKMIWGG